MTNPRDGFYSDQDNKLHIEIVNVQKPGFVSCSTLLSRIRVRML